MPYAKRLIARCYNRVGFREDLKQIALIGLWELASRNPDTSDDKLMRLGHKAIREKIFTGLYREGLVLDGKGHPQVNRRFQRAQKAFRKAHNRDPTAKELSLITKMKLPVVVEWLIKDSHIHYSIENPDSPFGERWFPDSYSRCYFLRRKHEYEDRLIYWIDRRWIRKAIWRLDLIHRQAIKASISEFSMTFWGKRLGVKKNTLCLRRNRGFQLLRLMADFRFNLNAPVGPIEYLHRKGVTIEKAGKGMPTVDGQYKIRKPRTDR